jgi:hypothetical protein
MTKNTDNVETRSTIRKVSLFYLLGSLTLRKDWVTQGRFTTAADLPVQTLGHIQHTCETPSFRTMWKELVREFSEVFNHYVEQTLWNTVRETEMKSPLTPVEEMKRKTGVPHEKNTEDRLWNKIPDGIPFRIPTKTKSGVICLMEFKRMSDVTNRYVVRSKCVKEEQYVSFRSLLNKTMQRPGWIEEQVSFIAGGWSLNEEELKKNLNSSRSPKKTA